MSQLLNALARIKATGFVPKGILDIGAYRGEWTKAAAVTFEKSEILMVEAQEELGDTLGRFHQLDPKRFQYKIALLGASAAAEVPFYVTKSKWGSSGSSAYREISEVPATLRHIPRLTLDELIEEANFPIFEFLKLDVQGAEIDVIAGGIQALKKVEFVMMELSVLPYNEGAPLSGEVIAFMHELGFEPFDMFDQRRDAVGNLVQLDVTFIRRGSDHCPTVQFEENLKG